MPATPAAVSWGLSPRVRGNLRCAVHQSDGTGSIPACAGEPQRQREWHPRPRVYPRVCGGTRRYVEDAEIAAGLSPRVRGNHRPTCNSSTPSGSIPACAGEPALAWWSASCRRVYPRVCGGTGKVNSPAVGRAGLSPRVRGNRGHGGSEAWREGSIPACAGEPTLRFCAAWAIGVYPRVCGGTATLPTSAPWPGGLSPRVRGNRRR